MKFKLIITSELFPVDEKYIVQSQNNMAYPEEYCYNKNNIQNYFNEIVNKIKTNELFDDWELEIRINIGGSLNDNCISIYKKGITYTKDKCKYVPICISLPCINEINWGVDKKRFVKKNSIKNDLTKIILVDYSKYTNMSEYLEDNIKKSIMELFKDGITLKKYRIKI